MNRDIIEFLYRHHYKYLFMVAFNICEKWDVAEDVVQDGFIKIITSKELFTDWQHGRRYLTGCIKNAAFERLGKEKRIQAIRRDYVTSDTRRNIPLEIKLIAAISKIKSSMSRVVINEIYFHNKTRREICKMYHISRDSIKREEKNGLNELSKLIVNQ